MTVLITVLVLFGLFMTWLIVANVRLNKHRGNMTMQESMDEWDIRGGGGMAPGG